MGQRFLCSWIMLVGGILFSANSFAVNDNANCGPGKTMAQSENAIITLNISSSVTYAGATTSSTSGCEGPFVALTPNAKIERYIALHYEQLSEEAAQGRGSYWEALAHLMGCDGKGQTSLLLAMHEAYPQLFSPTPPLQTQSAQTTALAQKIRELVRQNPQLSQQCTLPTS